MNEKIREAFEKSWTGTQIFLFAKYDQEIDCYVETRFDQASLRLRTVLNKSYNDFKAGYKAALSKSQEKNPSKSTVLNRLIDSTIFIEKIMYQVKPRLWSDTQTEGYRALETGKDFVTSLTGLSWERVKEINK